MVGVVDREPDIEVGRDHDPGSDRRNVEADLGQPAIGGNLTDREGSLGQRTVVGAQLPGPGLGRNAGDVCPQVQDHILVRQNRAPFFLEKKARGIKGEGV